MTPLELSYPLSGLVLALGSGIYVWQSRRSLENIKAQSPVAQTSEDPIALPTTTPTSALEQSSTPAELLHVKGKLRQLEKELQTAQASLKNALAEKEQLTADYHSQENMLMAVRQQLAHCDENQSDKLLRLQKLNQELLEENTNLSDRLKQAVNEVAETRPQLVRLQNLETRNGQLTEQLSHIEKEQQKAIAKRLEIQEKTWQQQQQNLYRQISQLEQQVKSLIEERDQAQQSWQQLHSQLASQQQLAQTQVNNLEQSLAQLTAAEQQWQEEQSQLTSKLTQLEASQKDLTLANAELKLKLETTQSEGDRLKTEKKEQGAALHNAQGEISQLQKQLAEALEAAQKVEEVPTPPDEPIPQAEEVVAEKVEEVKEIVAEVQEVEPMPEVEDVVEKVEEVEPMPQVEDVVEKVEEVEPISQVEEIVDDIVAEVQEVEPMPQVEEIVEDAVEKVQEVESVPQVEEVVEEPTASEHLLTGKKVVILGTLNAMNREEAKTRLQNVGAECPGAPSGQTDYVVVGKAPGAKLKKAQKLGIPQLSESQFLELLGG